MKAVEAKVEAEDPAQALRVMTSNGDGSIMQEGHEETVIGFLVNYPGRLIEFAPQIDPDLFFYSKNRLVLDALSGLLEDGVQISLISVSDRLRETGLLDAVGGEVYLTHLVTTYQIGEAAFGYALERLRESASVRAVARIGARMAAGDLSPSDAMAELVRVEQRSIPSANGLTIRTAEEIRTMALDEFDCLMGDRLLAKGQSMVIAGASGLGKSRLLLQMAASCITGREWCGFTTHATGMRWLILQTENSNRRLQSDLVALERWLGSSWAEVGQSLFIHTLETDRDGVLTLSDPKVARALDATIQQIKPHIIGFDPLRDMIVGDPNSDADMAATLAQIGATCRRGNKQRAIILLHHALTGKAGAVKASGYDRSSFARNSKVLHGWTRGQINIAPGSADNNETLVMTCGKNSNGKEFTPIAVNLNPSTLIYEPDEFFDLENWRAEVAASGNGAKRRVFKPTIIKEVFDAVGQNELSKPDLVNAIKREVGCGPSRAYELIGEAEDQRLIRRHRTSKKYGLAA